MSRVHSDRHPHRRRWVVLRWLPSKTLHRELAARCQSLRPEVGVRHLSLLPQGCGVERGRRGAPRGGNPPARHGGLAARHRPILVCTSNRRPGVISPDTHMEMVRGQCRGGLGARPRSPGLPERRVVDGLNRTTKQRRRVAHKAHRETNWVAIKRSRDNDAVYFTMTPCTTHGRVGTWRE
jgi:hypothetical protein